MSHSIWVRGLKYGILEHKEIAKIMSHSIWVRGLKCATFYIANLTCYSHSTRVRELKSSEQAVTPASFCRTLQEYKQTNNLIIYENLNNQ